MKRRTFLKTTGALGLHLALPGTRAWTLTRPASGFLTERTSHRMLFPRPLDGATLAISPVGLAGLPCPGAASYGVDIFARGKDRVYSRRIGKDPVHLPDRVFPAGDYSWDVTAFDAAGTDRARRGRQSFSIAEGAASLPWIDPATLLQRVPESRPRILFPQANLAAVRATLTTTRKQTWQACRSAADRALTKGVPDVPTYHRIEDAGTRRLEYQKYFSYFRGYVNGALMDLALAFLMTEEEKYARAAKRILLEIATWPTDDDDVTSVSARWGDEAGLSFSKCAHVAYDWLYPALDETERQAVAAMCRARAGQTHRRLLRHDYLTYPGESHDGRLIAYLTDMALALHDAAPEARTWLDYSLKALLTFYPHWAGSDGGWAEGTAYGLWYNTFYIPALEGLRQLAGYDLWQRPFFSQVRYFFFYCTANLGEIRPFGDSAEGGGPGIKGGSGYAELMAFHAHRYRDPHIGWWVEQIPGYGGGGQGALALLHEDKLPAQTPTNLPHSRVFPSVGWAGLHSDITRPAEDTCLIFKSSPYGSVSHSHADQNAFAIMKGGTALAIPSGHYGPSYGKPHHALWTRSTRANNCILVNGQGQTVRSAQAQGKIVRFEDAAGHTYVAGDATAAYEGKLESWVRHILFLRPGVFLLLDDIAAPQPSHFQWLLHTFEKMDIQGTRVTSRRKQAVLEVSLACPRGLDLSQTDQFDTPYNHGIPPAYHRDKPRHWHLTAHTTEKAGRTRIAAIMAVDRLPHRTRMEFPQEKGWYGVIATGEFGRVEGWVRLEETGTRPAGFDQVKRGQASQICARTGTGDILVL
jgi:hypothetical protein